MATLNKSKNVIGVFVLLLLIEVTPTAIACQLSPSLDRSYCVKVLSGSWSSNNAATCTINTGQNLPSFNIPSGRTLVINNAVYLYSGIILNNKGTIIINKSGSLNNNYGTINSTGKIDNYGTVFNGAQWSGCVIDELGSYNTTAPSC